MALTPFTSALLQRFSDSGNDGGSTPTNNIRRTPALHVGGHEFSVILLDTAGVQTGTKVQVNNSNPIDPNKVDHAFQPIQLGMGWKEQDLRNSGAGGGPDNEHKESSASAANFNSNWVDLTDALIDTSDQYVGSGSWRYIRLVNAADLNATLSAYVFSRELSTNF